MRFSSMIVLALAAFAAGETVPKADEDTIVFELPPKDGHAFVETFQESFSWVLSNDPKYTNQPVEASTDSEAVTPFESDKSILFKHANKHYGVSKAFDEPIDTTDKTLVVQYEVKLTEGLTCGGAYLKLLKAEDTPDLKLMNNDSPYVIMFGPDSCGDTNKVHFIFRHRNPVSGEWEEKHAQNTPAPVKDRMSHLYTLIIRPDNSYEILVDLESKSKGSLLEDFKPAVNPPKEIDDPEDFKPADWVDEAEIRDPTAVKPDDWDEDAPQKIDDPSATMPKDWILDEPDFVADPTASQPADWDEEEDGDWEAPLIANPKCARVSGCGEWKPPQIQNPDYKGKWVAPMIANPEYKGVWQAKQIPNPTYFEDAHPHNMASIGAVAVEIWTTNGGIRMDNFLVGHNEDKAKEFGQLTWKHKHDIEDKALLDQAKARTHEDRQKKKEEGGILNLVEAYTGDLVDIVMENMVASGISFLVLFASLMYYLTSIGGSTPTRPVVYEPPAKNDEPAEEEETDEPAEEQEGEAAAEDDKEDE